MQYLCVDDYQTRAYIAEVCFSRILSGPPRALIRRGRHGGQTGAHWRAPFADARSSSKARRASPGFVQRTRGTQEEQAVKLDLPSIAEVQARGHEVSYYSTAPGLRQSYASERLPSIPQSISSSATSPRVSSISSLTSSHQGSLSSYTSASSSNGPTTPSPTLPVSTAVSSHSSSGSTGGYEQHYTAMNQAPEMYYQQHITATQPPQQSAVTSGAVTYAHQPPLLPPGPTQYPAPHYSGYPFNGLTSPPNPPSVPNPLSASVLPLPSVANQNYQGFDSTGQIAPPGMKPRVTATLWEDEGSLCFQVEAKGICVARREGTFQ